MKQYQHLSSEERHYIWQALREGKSQAEIARALGRHPSTICREIKRNKYARCHIYTYHWAMVIWRARKSIANGKKYRKLTPELEAIIIELIKKRLSPEQVSGYLKLHHDMSISYETIYRFIASDPKRKAELKPYMRQGKKRRKRYGSGARASLIPNRISISERPDVVESKQRIGDWECDTVVGKDRKSVLVTLVDRASLFTLSTRLFSKKAKAVADAMIRLLTPYKDRVKTLTFDNGSEFVQHARVGEVFNAKTYFANPYSSWERGINENTNGLLRQYFPKKTDFSKISSKQLKDAVDELNNRPRKTRGYLSPNQMFNDVFVPLI